MRFSGKEIGRIVDRTVFRENPHWARPVLEKLVVERIIWRDEGYYLYPTEKTEDAPACDAGDNQTRVHSNASTEAVDVTAAHRPPQYFKAA